MSELLESIYEIRLDVVTDNVTLLHGTFAFPHELFKKSFSSSEKLETTTDGLEV